MGQLKATLLFLYSLASVAAMGSAFSYFWRINSQLLREQRLSSDSQAPSAANTNTEPQIQPATPS